MTYKLIIGLTLAVFLCSVFGQAQNTCRVAPSITKRAGSDYVEGGRNHSVFDITINNVGSCTVQSINIFINVSGTIEQYWNLGGSPINEIVGFGGYLASGQIFAGSGLIASNNGAVSASITVTGVSCRSCNTTSGSGNATTSSSSTTGSGSGNATTSSGSTTGSATTTSGSTTGGFTGCPASVNTTLRQSYTSGSTINYVYDISVSNLAPYVLNNVQISYAVENRTITQTWNLIQTCCTQIASVVSYNVTLYNLQPGRTFSGAGFIQTLPSGTASTAPVALVYNPATGLICGL